MKIKSIAVVALISCILLSGACGGLGEARNSPSPEFTPTVMAGGITPTPTPIPTPTPLQSLIDPAGDTIRTRILPLEGFVRKEADDYGEYLRDLPLLADSSPVLLYNGELSPLSGRHAAVIDIDTGTRDLQQCADAALRLRCEYLFSIGEYDKINYHLTNGDELPYSKYRDGYRLKVNGNKTSMHKTAKRDESYETFREYLDVLFNYASTRSLYPESEQIAFDDIKIGDVLLFAGKPGHCIIIIDICEDAIGNKAMLLAQSSMPAQQIHIISKLDNRPWVVLSEGSFPVIIEGWTFTLEHIRRIP